jgi:sugar lactone lactonase YvrE
MKKLLEGGHFYEGARWRDGHWWVSDLYAHHVLKIAPDGRSEIVARVEQQPSGLGWLADGTLLIVSMKDRRALRLNADGTTALHADILALTGSLANDMATDSRGNAWVSNLGFDLFTGEAPRPADLVHIAPDGTARIAAEGLLFPNGMVVTPDDRTLIVAETFGGRLTAFTIGEDGALSDRRIWATVGITPPWESLHTLGQTDIMPDGCALDDQGCVWMADAMNARVVRVAEGKGIIAEIRAPDGMGLYSCALGGPNRTDLLLCTAPDYDDVKRAAKAEAVLYTTDISARS